MTRTLGLSNRQTVPEESLYSGIWLRWSALSEAERVVCAGFALLPVWWVLGWSSLLLFLALGIVAWDVRRHGSVQLGRPGPAVIAAAAFGFYVLVSVMLRTPKLNVGPIFSTITTWTSFAFLLWYIESNRIRVRPRVVAWACGAAVVQMLLFWLVVHFVFHEPYFSPPRSLIGLVTDRGERYIRGAGNRNYLIPYWVGDKGFAGLVRFSFFFHGPEAFATVAGFMALLALDLKRRLWSVLLFSACVFLLLLSGTRSVWLAFPAVLAARYLLTYGRAWGAAALLGLLAVASFAVLSVPPLTDALLNASTGTVEAAGSFRADSTELRAKIYRRTLERFDEEPLFGHGVPGPNVVPGFKYDTVYGPGTHSFLLGTLLYRNGLVGTGIFVIFWASLILSFTRAGPAKPLCCLLAPLLFTLTFCVMELESVVVLPLLLVCAVLYESESIPVPGERNA
ncbi:MAG: O-antigen ligase family protein [Gemmatimonadaceae bacterium]|nr:O-antigen ligase family protein [Gloeobacterales cyanobacterium ES-bin-141]